MIGTKPRLPLVVICLVWAALYGWMLLQSGQPFSGRPLLATGTPDASVLSRFGASIPDRVVGEGAWWRIGSSIWLFQSLLGFIFALWIAWSVGSQLLMRVGAARTLVVLLVGGAAAAAFHAYRHPDSVFSQTHGFLTVVALLGGLFAWGIRAGPDGKAVRRSCFVTFVIFAILHWAFTHNLPDSDEANALSDPWPMVVAAAGGGTLVFLLPARDQLNGVATGLAVLAVLGAGFCLAKQVPVMASAGAQSAADQFFDELIATEKLALSLWHGKPRDANELKRRVDTIPNHKFLEGDNDAVVLLKAYVKRMDPMIYGKMPDPDGVRVRLQRAQKAWMDGFETDARARVGLRPRPPHQWFWKRAGE